MILLNFSHPLTAAQAAQIDALTGHLPAQVIEVPVHFDEAAPFAPQVRARVNAVGLDARAWQATPRLRVLPARNGVADQIELYLPADQRMGYFPPLLRTRPVADSLPRTYEIAEVLDLQALRDDARKQR